MPVLKNPKHERFAQELARGSSAAAAYETAGFKPSRPNASRLQHDENVRQRVAEILAHKEKITEKATEKAIENAALSKEWVLERLMSNVERSMQEEPVIIGGKATGEYTYNGAVANRALELLGKEMGMFIDRSAVTNVNLDITDQPLTDDEWAEKHVTPN